MEQKEKRFNLPQLYYTKKDENESNNVVTIKSKFLKLYTNHMKTIIYYLKII